MSGKEDPRVGVRDVGDREREARIKPAQEQLAQWGDIGKYTKQVMAQIEALKRPKTKAP